MLTDISPRRPADQAARTVRMLCGLLAIASMATIAVRAEEPSETHTMPRGQVMKGPSHLKKDSTAMPKGPHTMPRGGKMGRCSKCGQMLPAPRAKSETHVMPKGQAMKGPTHLKKDSTKMPEGEHSMPRGGMMDH